MRSAEFVRYLFRTWVPLAVLATCIAGMIYIVAQQSIRLSAEDPQVQLVEDAATSLENGASPSSILPRTIDISESLSPFVMVFDDAGNIVASSALVNGAPLTLPDGVFVDAAARGDVRFTLEQPTGERSAVALISYTGTLPGFVLAGRSLREPEARIRKLGTDILVLYLSTLAVTLMATSVVGLLTRNNIESA